MKVTAVKTKLLEANKYTLTEVLSESIDNISKASLLL